MKILVTTIFYLVISAVAWGGMANWFDIFRLKEIMQSYEREELVVGSMDEYVINESYDLNWKDYNPCDVVFENRQEYQYSNNFNNNRSVSSSYYVNLGDLEVLPIRENLTKETTNIIPLRSSKEKIRSYVKTIFNDSRETKSYLSYQLIWIKFQESNLRKEFGRRLISTIQMCKARDNKI